MGWLLLQLSGGYARHHPLRAVVQIFAIAVGVALGYAINLINASAHDEFSGAVRHVLGQADLSVNGGRVGFDEELYARIAALPEVEIASPVVEIEAPVPSMPRSAAGLATLKVIGLDVFRAAPLSTALLGEPDPPSAGPFALLGGGLYLSPAALERFGLKPGDTIALQAGPKAVDLRIAGRLPRARAGEEVAVLDIAAAQALFSQVGRLHRIDIKLAASVSPAAAREKIAALLQPGVALNTPDEAAQRVSNVSRAYRVNLNVLALVALFTGAFLVFSLQAQAVVARRTELAFLRITGVTAGELERWLVVEAALTGVIGSALGLAFGVALAAAALAALGGDLGSGFFAGARARLAISPPWTLAFFILGVAASIAGGWSPAREAARVEPALALKAGSELDALKPLARTVWPAWSILALGAACAFLPPVGDLPVFGYISIALLLIGAIMLQPRLAHAVFERIGAASRGARSVPWLGATTRLAQAPAGAAIGLAGIVASFALMVAMATMVTSFRQSLDVWLGQVLPADLYARAGSRGESTTTAYFSEHDRSLLASAPGVERVEFSRFVRVTLDPKRPPITLLVRPLDPSRPALPLIGPAIGWKEGIDPPPAWISEPMSELYGIAAGHRVRIPLAGAEYEFIVLGTWRDYSRQSGAIALRDTDYQRITGDAVRTDAALWLAPGVRANDVIDAVRDRLDAGAQAEFFQPGTIRRLSLDIFDRSFAVTYLLEVAAIVIGLIGIAATFSSQALARSKEFGMLRHLGVTRGQILGQFAIEGLLVTLLGIVSGLAVGFAVALVLIHVVNPQSFHWTMELHVPSGLIALLIAALLATATLTALIAGRRAASGEAVRAVSEDW
ncbi:MAG TPA: FtsX-like permease family protein [Burkholderiaceae bacterium]|nr:FtsX-like permease family protein [Burkholderiaceae bacterium]